MTKPPGNLLSRPFAGTEQNLLQAHQAIDRVVALCAPQDGGFALMAQRRGAIINLQNKLSLFLPEDRIRDLSELISNFDASLDTTDLSDRHRDQSNWDSLIVNLQRHNFFPSANLIEAGLSGIRTFLDRVHLSSAEISASSIQKGAGAVFEGGVSETEIDRAFDELFGASHQPGVPPSESFVRFNTNPPPPQPGG